MKHDIVVAGNIGVGKSTLVGLLSARFGWQPFYEAVPPLFGRFLSRHAPLEFSLAGVFPYGQDEVVFESGELSPDFKSTPLQKIQENRDSTPPNRGTR
jgi:hypothetical protein